jgi:hypothetical protein
MVVVEPCGEVLGPLDGRPEDDELHAAPIITDIASAIP